MAAFVVLSLSDGEAGKIAQGVLFLLFLIAIPIFLAVVLYRNGDKLETEVIKKKIGSLYAGKDVSESHNHRVWVSPLMFFYRRLFFIVASVYLFDHPSMQMLVH